MPIREMFWSAGTGRDIHLLHGERSRDLRLASLGFTAVLPGGAETNSFAKAYLDAHTGANEDVKLEFRPTFKAQLLGNVWTNLDIMVDRVTGEVSFTPGPMPADTFTNFIIEAVITQNTGGIAPAKIQPARIRVHVHRAATRMWLTPSSLRVRRLTPADADDTRYRFTVRVEFDDGTVGDLTTHHSVTWEPPANIYTFGQPGFLRIPAGVAAGTVVPIKASWPSFAGTLTTPTANMVVAAPWSAGPPAQKAELLDGHPDTWAGTINPEVVPNVLFFGDGFSTAPADQAAFKAITNKLVHDLKSDSLTRPYDRLATSMNYWRVNVPSTSRGVSARCEVYTMAAGAKVVAKPVPPALPPPAAGAWKVTHLIYAVGLPMPSDVAPAGETGPQATAKRAALRARWTTLARTAPTEAVLADAVINEWRAIGTRTFIDEIDAFPAMGLGAPPAASDQSVTPLLLLHPDRGGDAGLGAFYHALRAANNVEIDGPGPAKNLGIVWAEDRPAFHFDNRSLVVAIAAFKGGRAQRTARHIDISLESSNAVIPVTVTVVGGRKVVAIDQTPPLPATVARDVWRVVAHELGHSFGLKDEYVDQPGSFTASEATLDTWSNMTSEAAVKDGAGKFRSDLIKWNWRRARKAAAISRLIAPSVGTDFDIHVKPGRAFQFASGDKVRLRAREWKKVLKRDPFECSTDLQVVSSNATGDILRVRGSPSPLELTLIPEGSVVYIPVPMPGGGAGEARMIAPKIAKWMEDNDRPLTPWPCDPEAQLGVDASGTIRGALPQLPAFDGYDGWWTHRNDVRVIGLYAGGSRLGCGIFHPAGSCMMRNSHSDASQFCAVCRFVMVDLIDPDKHWWIDLDYNKIYPG